SPSAAPQAPPPTAAPAVPSPPPPAPPTLRFGWPVPGRAAVTQVALKDGHTSTMRYDLTTRRSADGGRIEVRFERFQFIEVDGRDLRAPELRAVREDLERMASMIPTLLVSPEGEFTGVEGMDEMIEGILARQRGQKKLDPAKTAQIEAFMRSPEMKATLTQKS